MANTIVLRLTGKTYALSVANTQYTAVQVQPNVNDVMNFAAFLNAGSTSVAIHIEKTAGAPATLPVDGTPGDYVLPPSMMNPLVLAVPEGSFFLTAIGSAAGPSLVYCTPLGDQS